MGTEDEAPFTYDVDTFVMGEVARGIDLMKLEADYAELYTELIADGSSMTADKRARLDRAADAVGLDRSKLQQIEQAMQAQFEARRGTLHEDIPPPPPSSTAQVIAPPPSVRGPESVRALAPLEEPGNPRVEAQNARIAFLESENAALRRQLATLETHCAVLEDKLMQLTRSVAPSLMPPAVSARAGSQPFFPPVPVPAPAPPTAPPHVSAHPTPVVPVAPPAPTHPTPPAPAPASATLPAMPAPIPPAAATPAPPVVGPVAAVRAVAAAMPDLDRNVLERTVAQNPRDTDSLHRFFRALRRRGETDRAWCVAHSLVYQGAADVDERAAHAAGASGTLIQPARSVSSDEWRDLIADEKADPLVGDILAEIVPPVLLARVTAARREGTRPLLDETQRLDPHRGTQPWARCFGWSAAVLGMAVPPVYADPSFAGTLEMVFGAPPVSRIGRAGLSVWRPRELAFAVGRHLTFYRREYFMSVLAASMKALEELFLASLSIGNSGLPMVEDVRRRIEPIAGAIHPMLDGAAEERLRACFLRFVEKGGKADLWSWATATDQAACRAGLLLASDLASAKTMLELEEPSRVEERMDDLLRYSVGEAYATLRQRIGVAA